MCCCAAGVLEAFGSQPLQLGGPCQLESLTALHSYAGLAGAQQVSEVSSQSAPVGMSCADTGSPISSLVTHKAQCLPRSPCMLPAQPRRCACSEQPHLACPLFAAANDGDVVRGQGVYYGGLPAAVELIRRGLSQPDRFKLLLGLAGAASRSPDAQQTPWAACPFVLHQCQLHWCQ